MKRRPGLFNGFWFDMEGRKIRRIYRHEYSDLYRLHAVHSDIRQGRSVELVLSDEDAELAKRRARATIRWCNEHGAVHRAKGSTLEGTERDDWLQLDSKAAEVAVSRLLSVGLPVAGPPVYTGDLVNGDEVRWAQRPDGYLVVREWDPADRRYWLVTGSMAYGRTPRFVVHGWLWGHEAKQRPLAGAEGTTPVHWVPQSELHPALNTGGQHE